MAVRDFYRTRVKLAQRREVGKTLCKQPRDVVATLGWNTRIYKAFHEGVGAIWTFHFLPYFGGESAHFIALNLPKFI